MKLFEIDPDQTDVPVGFVAYILRAEWVYEGRVSKVHLAGDKPDLDFDGEGGFRPPEFEGEVSRLFVHKDAYIDPRVLELEAKG